MKEFERFERYQPISDCIHARVLGTVAEEFVIPTGANWVVITTNATAAEPAYVKFIPQSQLSLITNGGFDTDTDWVKGVGWTIADEHATGGPAISTSLSQTGLDLQAGRAYKLTFTTTRDAGSITGMVGGTGGSARSSANTFVETIVCGVSPALGVVFTTAGFTGTLDAVSLVGVASIAAADDASGYASEMFCGGMQPVVRGISGYAGVSAIATSGTTPILNLAYYA